MQRNGYTVVEHPLRTRDKTDAFMARHEVETTPQTFIGGEWIGGYDDVRAGFGSPLREADKTSYQPVIALFATALLMACAFPWAADRQLLVLEISNGS